MHIYGIYKNGADVPICRAGIETQRDLWTQEEKELLINPLAHPALFEPMDCSMPGFPVFHHLLEFAQTHVH